MEHTREEEEKPDWSFPMYTVYGMYSSLQGMPGHLWDPRNFRGETGRALNCKLSKQFLCIATRSSGSWRSQLWLGGWEGKFCNLPRSLLPLRHRPPRNLHLLPNRPLPPAGPSCQRLPVLRPYLLWARTTRAPLDSRRLNLLLPEPFRKGALGQEEWPLLGVRG